MPSDKANSKVFQRYLEAGRLWKQFDEEYRKAALSIGISESAFEVLFALHDLGEGCLQRDICQYACVSKQTINSSVHKLSEQGYLCLQPAESGRGMRLFLTPEGKALMDERVAPFADADFAAFCALSEAEQEEVLRVERRYLSGISEAFFSLAQSRNR